MDVILKLEVPTTAPKGSDFSFRATVTNIGPENADGAKFRVNLEPGTTNITTECVSEENGASCPTSINVNDGDGSEAPYITGDFLSLPRDGKIIFNIKGNYPNDNSSASTRFQVTMPDGVTDTDPLTNTIDQQTSLTGTPSITVSKVQDKEVVGLGEPRVYTVTYANTGDTDVSIRIDDKEYFYGIKTEGVSGNSLSVNVNSNTTCDPSSTIDCPSDFPYNYVRKGMRAEHFESSNVVIPAGKKLVLKTRVVVDDVCGDYAYIHSSNVASGSLNNKDTFSDGTKLREVTVNGRIINIPACPKASLDISKVQDKEVVGLGEPRVYTVTYANTGDTDVSIRIDDKEYFYGIKTEGVSGNSLSVNVNSNTTCDPSSTIDCPSDFPYNYVRKGMRAEHFESSNVVIPAGKKLVLKTRVVVDDVCGDYAYIHSSNVASGSLNNKDTFSDGTKLREVTVNGRIINIPACPKASLDISKVQDKEVVGLGEPRVYTVTYANTGDTDVSIRIDDKEYFYGIKTEGVSGNSLSVNVNSNTTCDPSSTIDCPSDFPYNYVRKGMRAEHFESSNVVIPAGKKLVLKTRVVVDDVCGDYAYIHSSNVASGSLNNKDTFSDGTKLREVTVNGRIMAGRCVDISTRTLLSSKNAVPGEKLVITSTIDNSLGRAENVPFEMFLPMFGVEQNFKKILDGTNFTPTCEVTRGQAQCPTDLRYDPVTNKVTGTIPVMPADSNININMEATFTSAGRFTESYRVSSQAHPVIGDLNLGNEGTNYSSDTFGWTSVKPIDFPPTPQTSDQCGPDNAVWADPGTSEQVTWTLSEGGRRITATVKEGYIFKDGSRVKDYGLVVDSNEPCPTPEIAVPPTPRVNDQCGPNNASWVVPADTDKVRFELTREKHLVAHAKDGYRFEGDKASHDYGVAPDSNEPCEIEVPPTPQVEDQCGPNNASWVVPADTDKVRFELTREKHLVAHAKAGFKFEGDKTSHDYGTAPDSNEPCPTPPGTPNKPKEPKPTPPKTSTPPPVVEKPRKLVNTGVDSNLGTLIVFMFMAGASLTITVRRKEKSKIS